MRRLWLLIGCFENEAASHGVLTPWPPLPSPTRPPPGEGEPPPLVFSGFWVVAPPLPGSGGLGDGRGGWGVRIPRDALAKGLPGRWNQHPPDLPTYADDRPRFTATRCSTCGGSGPRWNVWPQRRGGGALSREAGEGRGGSLLSRIGPGPGVSAARFPDPGRCPGLSDRTAGLRQCRLNVGSKTPWK
jgi:hypothetical protein